MMDWGNSKILHTHLKNGALQGTSVIIKDGLELLEGYNTVNYYKDIVLSDGEIYNCNIGKKIYFNKAWYNNKLELIQDFTIQDRLEINKLLPF